MLWKDTVQGRTYQFVNSGGKSVILCKLHWEALFFSHFIIDLLFICLFSISFSIFKLFFLLTDNKINELTNKTYEVNDDEIFQSLWMLCLLWTGLCFLKTSCQNMMAIRLRTNSQLISFIFKYRFLIVYAVIADNLLNSGHSPAGVMYQYKYTNESMVPFFFPPSLPLPPNFISFTLLCFPLTSQLCGYLESSPSVSRVL